MSFILGLLAGSAIGVLVMCMLQINKAPHPKTKAVDVEWAYCEIDYTEAFGDVKYQNRNKQKGIFQ